MVLKIKQYQIGTIFKVAILIPICIFLYVAASGYFFGVSKNLLFTIVSWFVIIPLLTLFLSKIILGDKYLALKSLISLVVFYGIMVFMIYDHYQTDFFKVMVASLIFNSLIISVGIAAKWFDRNTVE